MRGIRWVKTILIVFLALFINGSVWAGERELIKNPVSSKFVIFPQHYQVLSSKLFSCDNNYIIVSNLFFEGGPDLFSKIISVNKNGNILWEKILGKKAPDNWISKVVCVQSQKYFALLGTVNYKFYYGGRGSGWIVIVNDNGKIIWDKEIKKGRITHINDGLITDDGLLMIVGNVYEGKEEENFKNSFLIKLDINGNIIFSKDYPKKISFI